MNTSEVKDLDSLRVWAALKRQERPDLKDEIISFVKWAETEVKQLEELKNQIQMLEDLKLENKNYDQMISSKLKALKEIEHNLNNLS